MKRARPAWWRFLPLLASLPVAVAGAERKPLHFDVRWVNPPGQTFPGVRHQVLPSRAMGCDVGFSIYLPPDYESSGARYPVIYWLHGSGGNESSRLWIARDLQGAIESRRISPLIMVFANGGAKTEYRDWPEQKVLPETMLIRELIPWVDQHYRTVAERGGRAIEGMSMGGNGAIKLAFKYPHLFHSVVAYAGSYRPLPADGNLPGVTPEQRAWIAQLSQWYSPDDDPFVLATRNAARLKDLRIRLIAGTRDGALEDAETLHQHLRKLDIAHEYEVLLGVAHSNTAYYERAGVEGFRFHWKGASPATP